MRESWGGRAYVVSDRAESRVLIVGLGNPGPEYAANRHNVGFHCVDRLARAHAISLAQRKGKAVLGTGIIAGRKVALVKPQTFVNLSGEAVAPIARFFKIEPEDTLVIYDDLDLPLGVIRVRPSGSSGGHNGIKSIIEHLGTQAFARLRVGIGRPPGRMAPKDYVLQDFGPDEAAEMEEVYGRVLSAVESFVRCGVRVTMNRFNARPSNGDGPDRAGSHERGRSSAS